MIRSASIRTRLAIGLLGVAALAVGVSTLLSERGLDPALSAAAARDVRQTGARAAAVLSARASRQGGQILPADVMAVEHPALLRGVVITVRGADGSIVNADAADDVLHDQARPDARSTFAVVGGDRTIGTVSATPLAGANVLAAQPELRHSLWRLHLAAGAIALAAALATALLLAWTLARPLRAIRAAAEALGDGDLTARIQPTGGPELVTVATALNQLAETLGQEETLRRRNVADLAHELRTPVGGLLARIEAAQDGVLEDERANLDAMHGEAMRLARFCDDVSRLAEAQRPGFLIHTTPVNLAAIAAGVVADFADAARERALDVRLLGSAATVDGDETRMRQIVENLLSNAIRYTDPGGLVDVVIAHEDGFARLSVVDTGVGIAQADLPNVFTRFWRAEQSRSRATGGSGVGLAIARELVTAQGGTITVESDVGRGTAFTVSFPLAARTHTPAGGNRGLVATTTADP